MKISKVLIVFRLKERLLDVSSFIMLSNNCLPLTGGMVTARSTVNRSSTFIDVFNG